jgi:RNA polymerase sigma-70 factor, ECF subfamily
MLADPVDKANNSDTAPPIGSLSVPEEMELVAAAKSGSSHAFEILVKRHAGRILRVARCVTGNREDAEDVVQQSFQKAFVHLPKFEGRSSFSTWLTRITINEARMRLRTNRRTTAVSIEELADGEGAAPALEIPDFGPGPELNCSQQERERILLLAVDQLKPEIRTAIRLCELDERPLKESAQIMGVSVAATKSRVLRGRRKLRETLKRNIAPKSLWGYKTSQINAAPNGNSHSPVSPVVRAKANGGAHGFDFIARCAGGFGVSVLRRSWGADSVEA